MERTWDADQVRAIHRHLFGDLYPWAGEYRTIAMTKNVSQFADPDDIDYYLNRAHQCITQTSWAQLDREGFAAAKTYVYLNTGGSALSG
ncbi:MAG: Fic family protein [Nocardioidaceae bacterium]